MGGNLKQLMRTTALALGLAWAVAGVAWAATLGAEGFVSTGRGYEDWYWLHQGGHAQWDFTALPIGSEPHLAVEALICLPVGDGTAPAAVEVQLRIRGSEAGAGRTWVASLRRIQTNDGYAMYYGQVFVSRREIGLGSRLTVQLDGAQAAIPVGVHPHGVRVALGPLAPVPQAVPHLPNGHPTLATATPTPAPAATVAYTRPLLDSPTANGAPFLSPGLYEGSLGWHGPYSQPAGRAVYRVHLRRGEILTLRVETASPCYLLLLDPAGRKVGEVEGGSWLGIEVRAEVAGAWQVVIGCHNGGPRFPFRLTLGIR